MYYQFMLLEINGDIFLFSYNNVANENIGKFIVNVKTDEVEVLEFAKLDKTGASLEKLLKRSLFLNKLKEYKETRQLDGKTYRINCG